MSVPVVRADPPGVLVVDLDDTLYSERTFHESGIRWLAHHYGLDPSGTAVQAALHALRVGGQPLQILSAATDIPVEALLEIHRSHPPEIALYPDASRLLKRARSNGMWVAVLTDGRSVTQRMKIKALGIANKVDLVFISEETGFEKSAPEAFAHVQKASPHPGRMTYVGDNPLKDIVHPVRLGWHVYLLRDRGNNIHPQDMDSVAVEFEVIDSLDRVAI